MCGIAGIIDFRQSRDLAALPHMANSLAHRGPDGQGIFEWNSAFADVGFAHTRLAILDLSANASQPMQYQNLVVVFNGEIYNFRELRKQLRDRGHQFLTESDTEVILHAYAEWGAQAFERFIGMFAIALLDRESQSIVLTRDRLGVKPLYVCHQPGRVLFASELKAIHSGISERPSLDYTSVLHYFQAGIVPRSRTIFKQVEKIVPGTYWRINLKTQAKEEQVYWDPAHFYSQPKLDLDFGEAADQLEEILISSCRYRMVSDVPVGVFLSGGYDSATVAALVQASSTVPLHTFTIGFKEGNNEAVAASQIATHLGTNHHELYCTEEMTREIICELPNIFDEPFCDSSAIPTILVSRMARKYVKVALSADGGDEFFGGYNSYRHLEAIYKRISKVPSIMRRIPHNAKGLFNSVLSPLPWRSTHVLRIFLESLERSNDLTCQQIHQRSHLLPDYLIKGMFSGDFLSEASRPSIVIHPEINAIEGAMLNDVKNYLSEDILVKVDRSTMSAGLEGREPLLDHRLLEFAARLPTSYKLESGKGKRVLREVAHRYLPETLLSRPKTGFSIPVLKWLRTSMSDLMLTYCSERALSRLGIFRSHFLNRQIAQYLKGGLHYSTLIWRLLVFQQWANRWL